MIAGGSPEPVWVRDDIHPGGCRENLYCPRCYSTDKERFAWLVLGPRVAKSDRVLHIAPEPHLAMQIQAMSAAYISGDLTPGRAMQVIDITATAFPDAHFDVVICSQVLEHIEDDRSAMREIYRLLAPGGWAYLPTPISNVRAVTYEDPTITSPTDRTTQFGQADHVRIYAWDYLDRLRAAGFSVTATRAGDQVYNWRRYALDPLDVAIIADKSGMLSTI